MVAIVDDDCEVRTSLQRFIEKSGYEAHAFGSGYDALSFLVARDVDVVLTDIRMPGMGGMELLDRAITVSPDTPVILMTAFADIGMTVDAIKKGAFDFIIKPCDMGYLLKALEKGITFRRLRMFERNYREELEKAVAERTSELKKAHEVMFQNEKMALVGQLAAGVAHEINNPVGFISSNLESLRRYTERLLEFMEVLTGAIGSYCPQTELERIEALRTKGHIQRIQEDIPALLDESREGAERIMAIVRNLKSFSRVDDNEFVPANINETMDKALNIVRNELKYVATIVTDYGDLPDIQCIPNQLMQVFMNLLVNAAHAIEGHGEILVRTWHGNGDVYVSVSDTGCGIPEEIMDHIFEPFFTTKESGKGTGLGLSISHAIIDKHSGEITVESTLGKGTTFRIRLPAVT